MMELILVVKKLKSEGCWWVRGTGGLEEPMALMRSNTVRKAEIWELWSESEKLELMFS